MLRLIEIYWVYSKNSWCHRLFITRDQQLEPAVEIPCPECNRTGVFREPDNTLHPCNYCKTKGTVYAVLY